jgi:acyl-CoA synthetase (NDP forming)
MIASASPTSYGQALEVLGHAAEVDIVFVIFIPTSMVHIPDISAALIEAKAKLPEGVPVVSVFLSASGIPSELAGAQIPSFTFPEAAARAMGRVATYASGGGARSARSSNRTASTATGLDRSSTRRWLRPVTTRAGCSSASRTPRRTPNRSRRPTDRGG